MIMKKKDNKTIFHIGRWSIVVARWALVAILLSVTIACTIFIAARLWLPSLAERKNDLESMVSQYTPYSVKIGQIGTYWEGVFPGVVLKDVLLLHPSKKLVIIKIPTVKASLALLPLLSGNLELRRLQLVEPEIRLVRDGEGKFVLNGIPVSTGTGDKKTEIENALLWLSKFHNVVIEGASFSWQDRLMRDRKYVVRDITVIMQNSPQHYRISITGKFPKTVCTTCYVTADLDGELLNPANRRIQLNVVAKNLLPSGFPKVIRQHFPSGVKGSFNTRIRLDIEDRELVFARGYLNSRNLVWPVKKWRKPFSIRELSGNVLWQGNASKWNLELSKMKLGLRNEPRKVGRINVSHDPEGSTFTINQLDVKDVTKFIRDLPIDGKVRKILEQTDPSGTLSDIKFSFRGLLEDITNFDLEAKLKNLRVSPYKKLPGLTNFSGSLKMSDKDGEINIDSDLLTLDMPYIFRWPIDTRRIIGKVRWGTEAKGWVIETPRIQLYSEDIVAEAEIRVDIPYNRNISPNVKVLAKFLEANVASTKKFVPKNLMGQGLISWIDRAIVGGKVSSGELIIDGPIDAFPFANNNGTFRALVHLDDGVLDYLPGWPRLENMNVALLFQGEEMIVSGSQGKMEGMDVGRLMVHSKNLGLEGGAIIHISGEINGELNTTLDVLRNSELQGKPTQFSNYIHPEMTGEGIGGISLHITLPTGKAGHTRIDGRYTPRKAALKLPLLNFRMSNITGAADFDESGPKVGNFKGEFLGAGASLGLERSGTGARAITRLNASGGWTGKGLARALDAWFLPYVKGEGKWSGNIIWDGSGQKINFKADTDSLAVDLPPPARKNAGDNSSLTLTTKSRGKQRLELGLEVSDYLSGILVFKNKSGRWGFYGGSMALGYPAPPPRTPGIALYVSGDILDMDRWQTLYSNYQDKKGKQTESTINQITASFDKVIAFDRDFGSMNFSFLSRDKEWKGRIKAEAISGKVAVDVTGQDARYYMDLSRLRIPKKPMRESKEDFDIYKIPAVKLKAKSFHYGKIDLGAVDVSFRPVKSGWLLEKLEIKRTESRLVASGSLEQRVKRHYGDFDVDISSDDMGTLLGALGYGGKIINGKMTLKSKLSWLGARKIDLETVKVQLDLKAEKGRFLKVEQGAAKMLGFLNVGTIGRILTLDFGSIFGSGFVFDDIKADGKIDKGNLVTRKTVITGPSAEIILSGRIGLVKEDYDLLMGVNPNLADPLAMTTLGLGIPQLTAAILFFKKFLPKKDKQVKTSAMTYRVTGSWEKPSVDRIELGDGNKETSGDNVDKDEEDNN